MFKENLPSDKFFGIYSNEIWSFSIDYNNKREKLRYTLMEMEIILNLNEFIK